MKNNSNTDFRPFYKTKRFYFALVFFFILFKIFLPNKKNSIAENEPDDYNNSPFFELLSESSPGGNYVNLNFLVKTENPDSLMAIAKSIKNKYCKDKDCNSVYFWLNENGFDLYIKSQANNYDSDPNNDLDENPSWKKKYWREICESNVAEVDFNSKSIIIYPMLGESFEYRKYGGKKKRPEVQEILIDN